MSELFEACKTPNEMASIPLDELLKDKRHDTLTQKLKEITWRLERRKITVDMAKKEIEALFTVLVEDSQKSKETPESKPIKATDLVREPEADENPWILENFIVRNGITLLAGEAGSYKTTLALLMASSIAKGETFLNLQIQKAKVLYIDLEAGRKFVKGKLKKIIDGKGTEFYILPKESQTFKTIFDKEFETLIEQFKGSVIIIDSFRRCFKGDENDSSVVNGVMNRLRELGLRYDVSFILLHHRGKSSENEYRGSSDILASVDVAYSLARGRGDEKRVLKLEGLKNRFNEEQSFIWEINEDQETITIRDLREEIEKQRRLEELGEIETIRQIILSFEEQGQKPNQSQIVVEAMERGLAKERTRLLLKKWADKYWSVMKGDKNQTLFSVSQKSDSIYNTGNWETGKLPSEDDSSEQGNFAKFWETGKLRNDEDLQLANSGKLSKDKEKLIFDPLNDLKAPEFFGILLSKTDDKGDRNSKYLVLKSCELPSLNLTLKKGQIISLEGIPQKKIDILIEGQIIEALKSH